MEISLALPRTEHFPDTLGFLPSCFFFSCPLKTLWPSSRLTQAEVCRATCVWKFHLGECLQDPDLRCCCDQFCVLSLDGIEQKIGRGLKDCSCALGTIETDNCFQDYFIFLGRASSLCNSLPQEILPMSLTPRQWANLYSNLNTQGTAEQGLSLTCDCVCDIFFHLCVYLVGFYLKCSSSYYICHRMSRWCN